MLNPVPAVEHNPDREEIDQVRNLLFGEMQRENEKRIATLEAQLRELHLTMERRLAAMAAETAASHANFVNALGAAVAELGQHISGLAGRSARDVTGHE
jgi:uncharacterized protein involved in exopolysaccharide biosynthesis